MKAPILILLGIIGMLEPKVFFPCLILVGVMSINWKESIKQISVKHTNNIDVGLGKQNV